jgi:hypothetical protein
MADAAVHHLVAVLPSRDSAESVAAQLSSIGVEPESIHIDDPADVAMMSKAMGTPQARKTKTKVVIITLLIGVLVATPLAFIDFAPHYWFRYILIFTVTVLIAGRALAVHFLFGPSDPAPGTTVLRVGTNAAHVRDVLEKSDAVKIQEVNVPAPR